MSDLLQRIISADKTRRVPTSTIMTPQHIENSITAIRRAAVECLHSTSPSPVLDVDMLLGELLDVDRAYLLAHGDHALTDEQRERFEAWVERAANGEPIAYILGKRGFHDLELIVTTDVLIRALKLKCCLNRR